MVPSKKLMFGVGGYTPLAHRSGHRMTGCSVAFHGYWWRTGYRDGSYFEKLCLKQTKCDSQVTMLYTHLSVIALNTVAMPKES